MKKRVKKILGLLLLVVFVNYYAGTTLFSHIHNVGGQSVSHSHPFSKSNTHEHSDNELCIICYISLFIAVCVTAFITGEIFRTAHIVQVCHPAVKYISRKREFRSLRAPPAVA